MQSLVFWELYKHKLCDVLPTLTASSIARASLSRDKAFLRSTYLDEQYKYYTSPTVRCQQAVSIPQRPWVRDE